MAALSGFVVVNAPSATVPVYAVENDYLQQSIDNKETKSEAIVYLKEGKGSGLKTRSPIQPSADVTFKDMRLEMVTEVILEKYYTLTLTTDHIGKKIKVAVEEENYKSINKIKKLLKLAY